MRRLAVRVNEARVRRYRFQRAQIRTARTGRGRNRPSCRAVQQLRSPNWCFSQGFSQSQMASTRVSPSCASQPPHINEPQAFALPFWVTRSKNPQNSVLVGSLRPCCLAQVISEVRDRFGRDNLLLAHFARGKKCGKFTLCVQRGAVLPIPSRWQCVRIRRVHGAPESGATSGMRAITPDWPNGSCRASNLLVR
jgi:hypothetical protein